MQRPDQISLNAIRVFVAVAECCSFKRAAAQLSVTPGAVSRQVLKLEETMGVQLFNRSNNAIRLTETGDTFLRQCQSGLSILGHAIETAMGDGREVSVQVPTTLATRWLIPLLSSFKQRWPDISVKIGTHDGIGVMQATQSDVTIAYFPLSQAPQHAEVLIQDHCQPYLAPGLLARLPDPTDLSRIPALQCTHSNWDWKAWSKETETPDVQLKFAGHFDLDDVALRAAISGMGMVLASDFIVRDDVAAGRLCALPAMPVVLLGHYTLDTTNSAPAAAETFAGWLRSTV